MINLLQLNTNYTIPCVIICSNLVSLLDGESREGGEWIHLIPCCTPVPTTAHTMTADLNSWGLNSPYHLLWFQGSVMEEGEGGCQAGRLPLCRQFREDSFQKEQLWLTQMNCKIVFGLKALLTEVSSGGRGAHEREGSSGLEGLPLPILWASDSGQVST